nr:hypothetical protein Iba_chr12cCG23790 [Ipomoea batatas]
MAPLVAPPSKQKTEHEEVQSANLEVNDGNERTTDPIGRNLESAAKPGDDGPKMTSVRENDTKKPMANSSADEGRHLPEAVSLSSWSLLGQQSQWWKLDQEMQQQHQQHMYPLLIFLSHLATNLCSKVALLSLQQRDIACPHVWECFGIPDKSTGVVLVRNMFGLWLENGLVCGRREGVDPLLGEEVQPFQSAKSQRSVKTEMALSLRVVVEIGHCLERHATCFLLGTCRDLYKRK